MATLYKKQGWWQISYFSEGKRMSKNTRIKALDENRSKAEKLKDEIEKLVNSQQRKENSAFEIISDKMTLNKAIEMYKDIFIIGKSEKHKQIFDYAISKLKSIIPGNTDVRDIKTEHLTLVVASLKKSLAQASQVTYFQYLQVCSCS